MPAIPTATVFTPPAKPANPCGTIVPTFSRRSAYQKKALV